MRIGFVAALALVATPALAAGPEEWVLVARNDKGSSIYIDQGSLQRRGDIVMGVEKWDNRADSSAEYPEMRIHIAYDCRARTAQIKSADFFTVDGKPSKTLSWTDEQSKPLAPDKDSIAESVLNQVCARA